MIIRKTTSGVPAGHYTAKFVGYQEVENLYGPGLHWEWEIEGSTHKGCKSGCTTAKRPTSKNSCGRILDGLLGRDSIDQDIDLDEFVGKKYLITVGAGVSGGTYVESVMLPPV